MDRDEDRQPTYGDTATSVGGTVPDEAARSVPTKRVLGTAAGAGIDVESLASGMVSADLGSLAGGPNETTGAGGVAAVAAVEVADAEGAGVGWGSVEAVGPGAGLVAVSAAGSTASATTSASASATSEQDSA